MHYWCNSFLFFSRGALKLKKLIFGGVNGLVIGYCGYSMMRGLEFCFILFDSVESWVKLGFLVGFLIFGNQWRKSP